MTVPAARFFELLASSGLQHGLQDILHSNGWVSTLGAEEDAEEDEDEDYLGAFRHRLMPKRHAGPVQWPKIPSDAGVELMGEGRFGTDQYYVDRLKQRKKVLATNLMWRELGVDVYGVQKRAHQAISQVSLSISMNTKHGVPGLITAWL